MASPVRIKRISAGAAWLIEHADLDASMPATLDARHWRAHAQVMSGEVKHSSSSARRRRRRAVRLIPGEVSERTTEYPGFFVLPRPEESPSHRLDDFKAAMIILLALGGFVAAFAYFFYQTGKSSTYSEPRPAANIDQPRPLREGP